MGRSDRTHGFRNLLSFDSDPKTHKSNVSGAGYLTVIQYLAPARLSGHNVCPAASDGCRAACLNTAGNPAFAAGKERARLARTQLYFADRAAYAALLVDELALWQERAAAQGYRLAVRLNGTSDIAWERVMPQLFATFPHVQFYDYTKQLRRLGRTPANYDLTLSRSETNHTECLAWLRDGGRCSAVFSPWRGQPLPAVHEGFPVDDGDTHDLLFLRPLRAWVGLRAKGKARRDQSGFVIR